MNTLLSSDILMAVRILIMVIWNVKAWIVVERLEAAGFPFGTGTYLPNDIFPQPRRLCLI
jgi:hypothetical protein